MHGRRGQPVRDACLADATSFLAGGGEMGALMRAKDWSQTALGPVEGWSQSLKTVVRIMLTSRYAMWMGWGPELSFFYNDAYRPTLGVKHSWALGSPASAVWAEIWKDIGPRIETVLRTGTATWDEGLLLFLQRSGYAEETYHTFSYSPLSDDRGRVCGMLCVVTEETDRVIGERRLASLRELAAELAGTNQRDAVFAAIGRSVSANRRDMPFTLTYLLENGGSEAKLSCATGIGTDHPAAPPIVDVSADGIWSGHDLRVGGGPILVPDLAGRFGALPTGDWDRPPTEAAIVPIARQGQDRSAGFLVVGINPYRRFDESYAGFLDLVAGQIASGIANATAYEEERKRAEALAELDRAKTTFFSNVSHEFRTPLTLMLGPLEEALARPDAAGGVDHRHLVEVAHRNGLRLLKLVNTLLDFSRIEAGRMQATFEPADLAGLTAELASNFRSAVEQAGLRLSVDCVPLAEPVYVDRDMWEKIVLNLLSNAFKFTFDGEIRVELKPAPHRRCVELRVQDTGVGVPPHELPRLFERFHRIEGQASRSFEGSGIGLSLVQELVRLHGGSIRAESEVGRGTTFIVTTPLGTGHLPGARIASEPTRARPAARAQAYLEEARRWLPGEPVEIVTMESPSAPEGRAEAAMSIAGRPPAILLADDNADMRGYVRRLLTRHGCEVEEVDNGRAALAAIRRARPDLVLSDVMMPQLDGFGLLGEIRRDPALRNIPVILVSARAGEGAKIEGLDAGADDYLVKPFAARELVARVSANLKMAQMRSEIAQELRARTVELETVLETVPTAVWFTYDRDARTVWGNRLAGELLRVTNGNPSLTAPAAERPGHFRLLRDGVELDPTMLPLQRAARGDNVPREELEVAFDDGSSAFMLIQAKPLRDAERQPIGAVCAAVDITDRRNAERAVQQLNETLETRVRERTNELAAANRQLLAELEERERVEETLRQMQRLEAIGQLTSGVAHDFNNLLTVVLGNIGFIERALPTADEKLARRLGYMRTAAERGAKLTAQLLAFSRRQRLEPKAVDLNTAVGGMRDLLQSTMGGTVRIETVLRPDLWSALVDPAQIELVVLNLAINARDAMQVGGTVTIETGNATLGSARRPEEPTAGEYVMVAVTDTGTGMSEVIRAKAFEPFFTTKEIGKGSGLGLSQVLGFAKQSGGGVGIDTRVGEGTTVRVYLPRATAAVSRPDSGLPDERGQSHAVGGATILVVDDDDGVCEVTSSMLRDAGYAVHEAGSGGAALELLERTRGIDAVLVDFAMPGMNGSELVRHIKGKFPRLPVLFVTGYADTQALAEVGEDNLVRKPFLDGEIERKLRRALGRPFAAKEDTPLRAAGS